MSYLREMRYPANPSDATAISVVAGEEVDAGLVRRAQAGDLSAFEELVRRHSGRIYRALTGITGNSEDAEDDLQNAFLKAFEHIGEFRGASKFTTWVRRIAINEGLQRLRRRKRLESLDDPGREEGESRQPQVWVRGDNPEQLYSRTELLELVERELTRLPGKYRVVVMMRDIEQLSTEAAAAALGLGMSTLKTRLLRGRLMLREALAAHLMGTRREADA